MGQRRKVKLENVVSEASEEEKLPETPQPKEEGRAVLRPWPTVTNELSVEEAVSGWKVWRLAKTNSTPAVTLMKEYCTERGLKFREMCRALSEHSPEWWMDLNKGETSELATHPVTVSRKLENPPEGEVGDYLQSLSMLKSRISSTKGLFPIDHKRFSPLVLAVVANNTRQMCDILKANSKSVNQVDNVGRNALFAASVLGLKECVETLLYHGAEIISTTSGKDALDYARACKEWRVLAVLNDHTMPQYQAQFHLGSISKVKTITPRGISTIV